ncbi:MAG: SDR family oxidoreductase [Parcubacteria group bacterium]
MTGAARGIGRNIIERFLESGTRLALLDTNIGPLQVWVKEFGDDIFLIKCDFRNKTQLTTARDRILAEFGRIDVLINNMGMLHPFNSSEAKREIDWRRVLDVNLTSAFLCTQAFGSPMLGCGGAIVNLFSAADKVPYCLQRAYSASKTGILLLTQQTAIEWGMHKVRANAVCPGFVETGRKAASFSVTEVLEGRATLVPRDRNGQPEDIANVVFFLASPEAEYINGKLLQVDVVLH